MGASDVNRLDLSPTAKKAALLLLEAHPEVEFTSGRRDLVSQARAMAGNVAKNPKWIVQTYKSNKASKACQDWVDHNPKASKSEIEAGLLAVLKKLGKDAGQISKHLTGDAFDVKPVTKNAEEIKATIKRLPGLSEFLDKEGGQTVWHAQF